MTPAEKCVAVYIFEFSFTLKLSQFVCLVLKTPIVGQF